jgi:membrane-bound ClpP family serine protease
LKHSVASSRPTPPGTGLRARVAVSIIRGALEEVAIYAIWRWLLPRYDINLPLFVLILIMAAWGSFAVFRFVLVNRALRKPETPGLPSLVGSTARVLTPLNPQGTVRTRGETWTAVLAEGERAEVGEEVTVTDMDGLRLVVRRGALRDD